MLAQRFLRPVGPTVIPTQQSHSGVLNHPRDAVHNGCSHWLSGYKVHNLPSWSESTRYRDTKKCDSLRDDEKSRSSHDNSPSRALGGIPRVRALHRGMVGASGPPNSFARLSSHSCRLACAVENSTPVHCPQSNRRVCR